MKEGWQLARGKFAKQWHKKAPKVKARNDRRRELKWQAHLKVLAGKGHELKLLRLPRWPRKSDAMHGKPSVLPYCIRCRRGVHSLKEPQNRGKPCEVWKHQREMKDSEMRPTLTWWKEWTQDKGNGDVIIKELRVTRQEQEDREARIAKRAKGPATEKEQARKRPRKTEHSEKNSRTMS